MLAIFVKSGVLEFLEMSGILRKNHRFSRIFWNSEIAEKYVKRMPVTLVADADPTIRRLRRRRNQLRVPPPDRGLIYTGNGSERGGLGDEWEVGTY